MECRRKELAGQQIHVGLVYSTCGPNLTANKLRRLLLYFRYFVDTADMKAHLRCYGQMACRCVWRGRGCVRYRRKCVGLSTNLDGVVTAAGTWK